MMRHFSMLFATLALLATMGCQETRIELVKSTTPKDDAKPNSDAVPAVYAIDAKIDRVVILRFKYQSDLLAGMESMVKQQNIHNAVILSAVGSVRGFHVHSVSNRTFPSKDLFIKNPESPADIVSMNGYVINGRIHAHMTMTNAHGAFGGHLEPGTEVFTFAVVTLGILNDGVDISRVDDKTYR